MVIEGICISYEETQSNNIEKRTNIQLRDGRDRNRESGFGPQKGTTAKPCLKSPKWGIWIWKWAKMPNDAGWYVAVVRCNCENTIAKSIELYFQNKRFGLNTGSDAENGSSRQTKQQER